MSVVIDLQKRVRELVMLLFFSSLIADPLNGSCCTSQRIVQGSDGKAESRRAWGPRREAYCMRGVNKTAKAGR